MTKQEQQAYNEAVLRGDWVWQNMLGEWVVTPKIAVDDFGLGAACFVYTRPLFETSRRSD